MNKKISHFFLAAIMAIVALMPMLAQSTFAQVSQDPAPRKVVLANQFNRRATLLSDVALRAESAVGVDRLLVLTAAQLGIPVSILQLEFNNLGLPMNSFIVGQLFARTAGVPSAFVFDLLNSGRNFGQIALQLNIPFKVTNLLLSGFMNTLIDEINISRGVIVATPEASIANLTAAMDTLHTRFVLFQNVLGVQTFNRLLLQRLSSETGIDVNALLVMRGQLPVEMTGDQFAAFVLLDNVVSSAVAVAIQFNGMAVVTPGGIFGRLNESQIPASLFLNRMIIFTRAINNDGNNA